MNKSKIEWCDFTWNPVTGCLNDCEYCYARKIVNRFNPKYDQYCHDCTQPEDERLREKRYELDSPFKYGFTPTLHSYRLLEPLYRKKSANIFVCSMGDLFGDWIPDEWIKQVFEACNKAPQHRYLFLTKNPVRYIELIKKNTLSDSDNIWFGTTATSFHNCLVYNKQLNMFISNEPLLTSMPAYLTDFADWVIVGAETGNRKDKVIPKREWIERIVEQCQETNTPLFMKNSLSELWGDSLIQEFPWEVV